MMGRGCRAESPHHPQSPDGHGKTLNIAAADRATGRATVSQPEPSPRGAKYTEEEERLDLSKGKERYSKMGFAEPSSQMEPKPIPFAPVPGDRTQLRWKWRLGGSRRDGSRSVCALRCELQQPRQQVRVPAPWYVGLFTSRCSLSRQHSQPLSKEGAEIPVSSSVS